jgi:hypothetical protein
MRQQHKKHSKSGFGSYQVPTEPSLMVTLYPIGFATISLAANLVSFVSRRKPHRTRRGPETTKGKAARMNRPMP